MTEQPPFSTRISEPIQTATKAVAATITSVGGLVALFVTAVADGSVSGAEWGTLLTAGLTAVATVAGVWSARNKAK